MQAEAYMGLLHHPESGIDQRTEGHGQQYCVQGAPDRRVRDHLGKTKANQQAEADGNGQRRRHQDQLPHQRAVEQCVHPLTPQ